MAIPSARSHTRNTQAVAFRPSTGALRHQRRARRQTSQHLRPSALLDFLSKFKPPPKVPVFGTQKISLGPLQVSPMGFGTWSWGNQFLWGYSQDMDPELQEVFNYVVGAGVNLFDTADSYGTGRLNGQSEKLLGKFIDELSGGSQKQDAIAVATKIAPYPWRLTSGQFANACRASLERLGKERLALGQLHWSTANYQPLQERALWDGLAAMYDQGLVEAVGVSNYGPKQLQRIHKHLTARGVPLASVQVQYSLLSQGKLQQATKAACDDLGLKLIAYSPLALGMLTGRYTTTGDASLPSGPRGLLFRQILPGAEPLLDLMQQVADERSRSVSQVAINWCMCQGTIPIPGAKSLTQAQDNCAAMEWRLSDGEMSALSEAADAVPRGMIQNIFQTS